MAAIGLGRGGPNPLAVFVNPRSRANRRNPRLAAQFQAILGDSGAVLAPATIGEVEEMARVLRRAPPPVVAVHGGDGTLHHTLTALWRAWDGDPLPPIALLPGGTMNVVAASLRIVERPAPFLAYVTQAVRAGRPLDTVRVRCLRVGDQLGFVFGNGLLANFLGEYYAAGGYGVGRALWLIARTLASTLVRGRFSRRVFRRFEGTVRVDGVALERTRFVGLAAGTVREVGLGFKLVHRAGEDPERFGLVAIHARPLALAPDLYRVHAGTGMAPKHAFSAIASTLEVEPSPPGCEMSYTVDGDLYRCEGPLQISIGPEVLLVRPERALIRRGNGDTMKVAR